MQEHFTSAKECMKLTSRSSEPLDSLLRSEERRLYITVLNKNLIVIVQKKDMHCIPQIQALLI
jgi:hypothetical protein